MCRSGASRYYRFPFSVLGWVGACPASTSVLFGLGGSTRFVEPRHLGLHEPVHSRLVENVAKEVKSTTGSNILIEHPVNLCISVGEIVVEFNGRVDVFVDAIQHKGMYNLVVEVTTSNIADHLWLRLLGYMISVYLVNTRPTLGVVVFPRGVNGMVLGETDGRVLYDIIRRGSRGKPIGPPNRKLCVYCELQSVCPYRY